ncbi:MAG: PIN domain-containing protein [Oscillospiraceae bacterium]|nr:PIN domain-containing protein [Oscillospiraceae bacterium]
MLLIDANAILRYMLNDNPEMAVKTRDLIANSKVYLRHEVLAEVVYVLNKVYMLPKTEIAASLEELLANPNIETEAKGVVAVALKAYKDLNMDFVDCILYAFKVVCNHDVFTFDKKLNSMINRIGSAEKA